jgi:tetratricopeptide (TPR) repeat protein
MASKAQNRFICLCILAVTMGVASAREREPQTARATIQAGQAACKVDMDGVAAGVTDASGKLSIAAIDPGDHYVHLDCPGKPEAAYFISPKVKEEAQVGPPPAAPPAADDAVVLAENKIKLRQLVVQATQLRAQARLDEAVSALRQAMQLDPANSDLHRELGITFLMAKEWKRARVEMIEAIRHDQTDADAHNGLGYAMEKLGDIDTAVKEYRLASHLEPDDPTYREHYFDALVKIQARQEAAKK